jgi:hydroxymethylpyrimidine/phosphomethylpyrimidine kinase
MITALTIAGSDSSGGAGIQADLKTFAAHDVYGVCAITAVTAQSTIGISTVHAVPADVVAAQIEAVVTDLGVHAGKTGMLANRDVVEQVASSLRTLDVPSVVVDPVIVSTSGTRLLDNEALESLKTELLPLARCVTPNRFEAELLTNRPIASVADAREAARHIVDLGPSAAVITGGHLPTEDVTEILFDGRDFLEFHGERLPPQATHGTGCTFSAAITAALANGRSLADAVQAAQTYVHDAIRRGIEPGAGSRLLTHP